MYREKNIEAKIPKYILIENDILRDIKSGKLKPGDKVAGESTLKNYYKVSAITVRKAFNDLINAGYLYGVQGLGTFVAKKQMIRGLTSISFSDELLQQGYAIDMIIDSIEEVYNEEAAEKLSIKKPELLICVKRVRVADNEPIAYTTSYIDTKLLTLEQAKSLYETRSFYKTLNQNQIYPAWVTETYSVKEIHDNRVLHLMRLEKGTNAFYAKRLGFNGRDETIEYSETYFNKDWYSVTVSIKM